MLKRSYKRIHFVGVGGAGVSALAHLLLQMNYEVTGSDLRSSTVTSELEKAGATVWQGHDERYARMADLVVTSTAIPDDNPEIAYAKAKGTPLLTRIELLRYLAERKQSVVISGSHGKSTTSSMVANACIWSRKDPTVVLGSVMRASMGSARLGESKMFICEGDESNNSILEFNPSIAVVTNIDCDHLDFHGNMSNLKDSFIRFLNSPGPKGNAVVCIDDENIRSVVPKLNSPLITYGFHPDANYRAEARRRNDEGGLTFEVHHSEDGPLGKIAMRYPGDHNIHNALATVATCRCLGVSFDNVASALENFPGIHRRYEILYHNGVTVIDDYAHHPSEIHALLSGAREVFEGRLRVVFQPHRFTRSKNLAQQFPPSFINADEIVLAPIYTANEKPIAGIGLDYLNRFFKNRYDERRLKCIGEFSEIQQYLRDSLQPGDVVMSVGAGDVYKISHELAAYLQQREHQAAEAVDLDRIEQSLAAGSSLFPEDEGAVLQ